MNLRRLVQPNVAAAGLLLLMAILAGGAAWRESVTVDEVAHVGAGVSYLQKLDFRMNEEHPPLAKVLAAIPLVIRRVHADYSHPSWTFSGGFFHQYLGEWAFGHAVITQWNDPYTTLRWARLPMLLLTLTLGWVIYAFGSRMGSAWGGLLCLAAYVTTPAFLTFGPLVLTDIAITLFSLLAMWALADMWREPTREAVVKFGLAFAGALLSKFSSGLLFFCFLAFILSLRLRPTADLPSDRIDRRRWRRRRFWSLAKGTLLAGVIVDAVYFVLTWNQPTDSFRVIPHFSASPVLRRLLMPLWMYLRGLSGFAFMSSRPTFILGHSYPHGVWFYFPVLFFLKSQTSFVLLLALAALTVIVAKRRLKGAFATVPDEMRLHWRAMWMFLLVFTAACMLSQLTISIRHFSVPLALLILMLAPLPRAIAALRDGWSGARLLVWATAALAVAAATVAVWIYPNYFPYLSAFGMGKPGYALMNDSNLDWNQSLPEVERFVEQRGLKSVLVDEYGFSKPEIYVPKAQFWNCQEPTASDAGQWAVVSAGMIEDGHNCLWLFQYPHQGLAGDSMYAFRLPSNIPAQGTAGGPPAPSAQRNFGGFPLQGDIRLVFLNTIRDPNQLQPTWDRMQAQFQAMMEEQKKKEEERAKARH
jgi:4-amino-4-deoxy-L-arabinose transferase-like glycosyltransferase